VRRKGLGARCQHISVSLRKIKHASEPNRSRTCGQASKANNLCHSMGFKTLRSSDPCFAPQQLEKRLEHFTDRDVLTLGWLGVKGKGERCVKRGGLKRSECLTDFCSDSRVRLLRRGYVEAPSS
jgi:hypothetical protein